MSRRRATTLAVAVGLVLNAAGCGTSSEPGTPSESDGRPLHLPVRSASVDSPLPEVVVRDLNASEWVQLKNMLPAQRPLLVWFWAPH